MHGTAHEVQDVKGGKGEVHEVYGGRRFEDLGYLFGIIQGDAAPGEHLIRAETYAERKVVADSLLTAPSTSRGKRMRFSRLPP